MKNTMAEVVKRVSGLYVMYSLQINTMEQTNYQKLEKALHHLKSAQLLLEEVVSSDNMKFSMLSAEEQITSEAQKIAEDSIFVENNVFMLKDVIEDISKALVSQ